MEDSNIEGYVAGSISILIGLFFLTSSGWNPTIIIFGSFFGILGGLSLWKPDSAGQVTSRILKNISKNVEESNRPSRKKEQKIEQTIVNSGTMINVAGSKHASTNLNSLDRSSKDERKEDYLKALLAELEYNKKKIDKNEIEGYYTSAFFKAKEANCLLDLPTNLRDKIIEAQTSIRAAQLKDNPHLYYSDRLDFQKLKKLSNYIIPKLRIYINNQ